MRRTELEICVETVADAVAARDGGADRVELCAALASGGVTPSAALVAAVVAVGLPVRAMVRPWDGGFVHDAAAVALVARDIEQLVQSGVAGVVVGALTPSGALDEDAMVRWRDAAGGLAMTLHRAVDLAGDPVAAVGRAAALGIDDVLTSGGAPTAVEGAGTIAAMVAAAASRVRIVAGSGVAPETAAALLDATGADVLHASASVADEWPDPRIAAFGFGAARRRRTCATRVAAIRRAIDEWDADQ